MKVLGSAIVRSAGHVAGLLMACCVLGAQAPHQAGDVPPGLEAHFPSETSVVEVPFRFEVGKIVLEVKVNGSEPLAFVLDTGAPRAVLMKPDRIAGVELEIAGEALIAGAGDEGGARKAKFARGVRFDVGELRLEGVGMVVMPEGALTGLGEPPWDGIVGAQLLATTVIEIDWDRGRLRLHDPSTFEAPDGVVSVPIENRGGHIFVASEVTIGDEVRAVELVVDTGASHALSLQSDEVPMPARRLFDATLGRGLNGVIKGDIGRVDRLRLGGVNLEGVVTGFPGRSTRNLSVGADGNLGTEVLRRFVVTFDYGRDRMLLQPTGALTEPFPFTTCGARTEPWIAKDGTVGIDDVFAASPAAQAGLMVGDRILAVNSRPVADLGIDALRALLSQAPGTILTLEVRQGETVRKVELELATVL